MCVSACFHIRSNCSNNHVPRRGTKHFFSRMGHLFARAKFDVGRGGCGSNYPRICLKGAYLCYRPRSLSNPILGRRVRLVRGVLTRKAAFQCLHASACNRVLSLARRRRLTCCRGARSVAVKNIFLSTFHAGHQGLCGDQRRILRVLIRGLHIGALHKGSICSGASPTCHCVERVCKGVISRKQLIRKYGRATSKGLPLYHATANERLGVGEQRSSEAR